MGNRMAEVKLTYLFFLQDQEVQDFPFLLMVHWDQQDLEVLGLLRVLVHLFDLYNK